MRYLNFILIIISIVSCKRTVEQKQIILKEFNVSNPVNTNDKAIVLQEKKAFIIDGIQASNNFDGARLNDFYSKNDSIIAVISPENYPINNSAWYAFKLTSKKTQTVDVYLKYKHGTHRYAPKISKDFKQWKLLEASLVSVIDTATVKLKLNLNANPLYVAAQPVQNSKIVYEWGVSKANEKRKWITIGSSRGGIPLKRLELNIDKNKPTICIIGRQHPPEVTGWFAQKEFTETLLNESELSKRFLKEFNVIVYPLLNPDGVNQGHWRTGLGGVDLNRDWALYKQSEIKQVAQSIVDFANTYNSEIVLGIDFHSTYYDVFYENNDPSFNLKLPNFKANWISVIKKSMPNETFKVSEIEQGKPISMDWFSRQFNAPGVTYEMGDDTTYEKIKYKAENTANTMMKLMLEWKLR